MSSRVFEEKLGKLDDYMRSKKFPAMLREKVKDYFHLQHSDGKLFDEEEILASVTPLLRREIVEHNNRDVLMKVPLLRDGNEIFSSEVASVIKPIISFPDEVILRENTTGTEMFFISSGVVEIYVESASHMTYVAIGDGCYCGEVSMLLSCKRTASARTKTQCMLFRCAAKQMQGILDDYPEKKDYMENVAICRQKRIFNYLSKESVELGEEDRDDQEDCKTDLFGVDASEVMMVKEEEFGKHKERARVSMSLRSAKSGREGGDF